MASIEDFIQRIIDAYEYEDFVNILVETDEGYRFVADRFQDLDDREDECNGS
jgi:Ribonuclease G/E